MQQAQMDGPSFISPDVEESIRDAIGDTYIVNGITFIGPVLKGR
jgi:hypothetical protein